MAFGYLIRPMHALRMNGNRYIAMDMCIQFVEEHH